MNHSTITHLVKRHPSAVDGEMLRLSPIASQDNALGHLCGCMATLSDHDVRLHFDFFDEAHPQQTVDAIWDMAARGLSAYAIIIEFVRAQTQDKIAAALNRDFWLLAGAVEHVVRRSPEHIPLI